MHRGFFALTPLATLAGCSLLVDTDGLSSGATNSDGAPDADLDVAAVEASLDAGDAASAPIEVLQHRTCAYDKRSSKTFPCTFAAPNTAGSALLVHFYYDFPDATLVTAKVTDDSENVYSFLNVSDASCPAGRLPGEVCCSTNGADGTCQGWAIATNARVTTKNPATIAFSLNGGPASAVMGAHILEISGLADVVLDRGASAPLAVETVIETPTIMTAAAGDLVLAGITFYASSAKLTPPAGWELEQDGEFFTATMFRTAGPAGTTYGGTSMGTITGMTKPGTSTMLALRAR